MSDAVPVPCSFHRIRVMFHDGATVDYIAYEADSHFRQWVVENHYGVKESSAKWDKKWRIEVIVDLGEEFVFTPTIDQEATDGC
jgi:hypothetical protein